VSPIKKNIYENLGISSKEPTKERCGLLASSWSDLKMALAF